MGSACPVIQTSALRKEYGTNVAVASLTLEVERGEVFAFLGPNGAGKTTSINMLLGLAKPTSGSGALLGRPISDRHCRQGVGFLPEHFRFHEWLHADEFLDLHARLSSVPAERRRRRIPELLEMVGLREAAKQPLGTYSKGMLQRVGLAQALVSDPELVFLDEPTSGLDPLGRRMVRDIIRWEGEKGTTIFLNSHLLSEVEVTCTRAAFITHGVVRKVTALGDYAEGLLQVDVRVGALDDGLEEGLRQWSPRVDLLDGHGLLRLHLADEGALPEISRWLVQRGTDLYSISPHRLSLEDLFVQIVGDEVL